MHNWFTFEPKESWFTPCYLPWICGRLNHMWGNAIALHYLQTGEFRWQPLW